MGANANEKACHCEARRAVAIRILSIRRMLGGHRPPHSSTPLNDNLSPYSKGAFRFPYRHEKSSDARIGQVDIPISAHSPTDCVLKPAGISHGLKSVHRTLFTLPAVGPAFRFPYGHEKTPVLLVPEFFHGDPYGNRTHVTAVKGRCLNRLTNGPGSGDLT